MKKLKICLLITCTLLLTGCNFKTKNMDDISIYTTTYPINYLINELYEEHAKIYSIYPTGVNLDEYKLTDRKLKDYSNSDLFIFNSLDKDRDYAVKMINLNEDLKVIDVSTGMNYKHSLEELWLDPSNYLMMADNIKTGLSEYINNPYLVEEISNNYTELEYNISKLDANLTETIQNGKYKTIVADDDMFKLLEKYNIKVISLEENNKLTDTTIEEVESLITNKQIKYIYSSKKTSNNTVNNLLKKHNIELISINAMHEVDGGISNSNDSYITIMNNNIDLLKKELYK